MRKVEALADCLRVVDDEVVSPLPEKAEKEARLAMALFVRCDLGQADPAARDIIARVFSVPAGAISPPPGRRPKRRDGDASGKRTRPRRGGERGR